VLAAVLLVVWGLSFVIPSGAYQVAPHTGGPKPGTYKEIETDKSIPHQFYTLWNAPTNGLYGIENDKGNVSVDNTGVLYGSAQIFLFVLAIGAFISVAMKTGAILTGIGRLALGLGFDRMTGELLGRQGEQTGIAGVVIVPLTMEERASVLLRWATCGSFELLPRGLNGTR